MKKTCTKCGGNARDSLCYNCKFIKSRDAWREFRKIRKQSKGLI